MFYPTVKEYKSIRYKGYDIFLELKLINKYGYNQATFIRLNIGSFM